jgi:hypothetical protein
MLSAVKKVQFGSDRMSYIILRGCWCHIIVLNVHATTEDETDWIDLAQDRDKWRALVKTVMNLCVPQNVGRFLSSCTTSGLSYSAQLQRVS